MRTLKIFVFNTFILLLSSVILQVITTFFNIYISNTIGEEGVGVFSLVISVYMFGITLASAGINIASTRIVAEELACKNEVGAKAAARRCVLLSLLFGIGASLIFFVSADFITIHCLQNRISKSVIYLICIALPFISMSAAINGYFTAVRRVYKNAFAKFGEEFVKIACTAFLLKFFMPDGIDYAWALKMVSISFLLLSISELFFIKTRRLSPIHAAAFVKQRSRIREAMQPHS